MASRLIPLSHTIYKLSGDVSRCFIQTRSYCYKSSLSLDKLYPGTSMKITTPEFTPEDPNEKFNGFIPIEKLEITYSCSSGPGGQHVNKVETKVDLRFKVTEADWLHPDIREKIIRENRNKITKEGYLIFKSDLTRSQQLNCADCMRKLRSMIRTAATPRPQISTVTLEKLRKQKEKANRDRLMVKRAESIKRSERQAPSFHDL